MARRVTLKDVAQAAGIAQATASHALNGNGTISVHTAARVQQVAAALGYRRDLTAAGLRRQRTSTIGLLIPRISDPFFGELTEALETAARARGYSLLGGTTNRDPRLEEHYIDLFLGRRCDGVIVIMGRETPDAIVRAGLPMVLVNCHATTKPSDAPLIEVDDCAGMEAAVAHLIGLGHRRIALVTIPRVELRCRGYRQALAHAHLPYDPALTVDAGDYLAARAGDTEAHHAICDRVLHLLREHPDVTAIAATTDVAALGAIRAAHLLGKRVPDDLAVVGFDGISIGSLTTPALTTMAQPIDTIAARAMDLIIEQMQEGGVDPSHRHLLLEATLVVRESCGSRRLS